MIIQSALKNYLTTYINQFRKKNVRKEKGEKEIRMYPSFIFFSFYKAPFSSLPLTDFFLSVLPKQKREKKTTFLNIKTHRKVRPGIQTKTFPNQWKARIPPQMAGALKELSNNKWIPSTSM